MKNIPKVGIGVIVTRDDKVLIGKRKGSHGEGSWALPGGHLEFGESWEDCARREVKEETGLDIENLRFGYATNDIFAEENKHYVTLFIIAESVSGEPQIMEPDKCDKWDWAKWGEFPKPLFVPLGNLLNTKFDPFK